MASVVAAAKAALAAVFVYFLGQRQVTVERERRASAEAIADALSWLELPKGSPLRILPGDWWRGRGLFHPAVGRVQQVRRCRYD